MAIYFHVCLVIKLVFFFSLLSYVMQVLILISYTDKISCITVCSLQQKLLIGHFSFKPLMPSIERRHVADSVTASE